MERRNWQIAEHSFGIGSGIIGVVGKTIQAHPKSFLTGNEDVDYFMHYNLDSIFGIAAIMYLLNMLVSGVRNGKDSSIAVFMWIISQHLKIELYEDPAEFKGGTDYVDLFGGVAAGSAYVGLAKLSGNKA